MLPVKKYCLIAVLAALQTPLVANAQEARISKSFTGLRSAQLTIGTQGAGAEFNYGISSVVALRAGANFIPFAADNIFKVSGFNSTSRVQAKFYNVHLLADYAPLKKFSNIRLVGGTAWFFKANGNVRVTPSETYNYGDIVLSRDQVGYVDLDVGWEGLAPYLGLAFADLFPKKRFNIGFDLGTYYLNSPDADIVGTGLLEGNSSQTARFRSNIKDYRWLPVLQLNFNFKL